MFYAWNLAIYVIVFQVWLTLKDNLGHCDVHTYGNSGVFANDKIFSKLIYARTTDVPQNYTIVFKYKAHGLSPLVHYCKFNITANSIGNIQVQNEIDHRKPKSVEATFIIYNATDLKVHALLRGLSIGNGIETIVNNYQHLLGTVPFFKPKSFALIYAHNETETNRRYVALGQRQDGDELIHHEEKLVRTSNRFAQDEFLFEQPTSSITCVEFSFNSPSAIAFIDSNFITENKINAIVYDLNRPQFNVNIFIYGYITAEKPDTYKPIVG